MKVITLIAVLCVLFLGVGYGVFCATGEEPVDMKGTVVGLCNGAPNDTINNTDSVLVEGIVAGTDKKINVSVKVNKDTKIMLKEGNKYVNSTFSALKPGQSLEIIFTGPFLQSYPPQTMANEIIII